MLRWPRSQASHFDLPFGFTIIHGIGRLVKAPMYYCERGKDGGGLGTEAN